MKRALTIIMLLLFCLSSKCYSSGELEIKWEDLRPTVGANEASIAKMPEEEQGKVEWIIYLRQYLPPNPEQIEEQDKEFYDEMTKAIPELKVKGIDIEKIIAERGLRNSTVNTELNGKSVALAGYLMPLDLSGTKMKNFLLVPWVGACIHTPPPPSNQIVHVVSQIPINYDLNNLFRPVTVHGEMEVKSLSKDLFLVDGTSKVDVGYSMTVETIERYDK